MNSLIGDLCVLGLIPGPREMVLLALVAVTLYGRSELARRGFARLVRPWTTRPSGAKRVMTTRWVGDRWFLILAACAALVVVVWVVSWMKGLYPSNAH